jgi:sulfite exporter TauE/SafE
MELWAIFLTGLTTGGVSCAAVQGGLLASIIANQKKQELDQKPQAAPPNITKLDRLDWLPVSMFLLAKLFSHTMLGFFLGGLGATITISLGVQLGLQVFTALFMLATAMNFLDVHPIFRRLAFQPPAFLRKMLKKQSQANHWFAPAVLGLLSIFIPCGVTQSMEVLAVTTGSPIQGALIMGTFVLGTAPIFALLGIATAKLTETWQAMFNKVAAAILIALAVYSFNGVLLVLDSPITINKIAWFFSDERFSQQKQEKQVAKLVDGVQKIQIDIVNNGYLPKQFTVKQGIPVELTLANGDVYSCAQAFVFREFDISTVVRSNTKQSFTFTPQEKGKFTFSCSMGMYSGTMTVI